jgi:uncharacterized membrane protein (UPF0136 family)
MQTWKIVIVYGIFLILAGVVGFASNPEKAKTALISGGVFGSLSIVWGILMAKGFGWARWGVLGMTLFLSLIFGWRTWASWMAVSAGEPKHVAAALITSMLIASLALLPFLIRNRALRD